jgi:hypothetical protein
MLVGCIHVFCLFCRKLHFLVIVCQRRRLKFSIAVDFFFLHLHCSKSTENTWIAWTWLDSTRSSCTPPDFRVWLDSTRLARFDLTQLARFESTRLDSVGGYALLRIFVTLLVSNNETSTKKPTSAYRLVWGQSKPQFTVGGRSTVPADSLSP